MDEIRIQKLLSRNGSYSRRRVEELILEKRIKVNGKVIDTLGLKCKESDVSEVDNKVIKIDLTKERVYLLLNKPKNYICSLSDPQNRKKIIDLINPSLGRLVPVGRLDFDTSGLIMLTNDGDFCNYIIHMFYFMLKEIELGENNNLYELANDLGKNIVENITKGKESICFGNIVEYFDNVDFGIPS